MPDYDLSPFDCGGSALADSARNLAAILQKAQDQEREPPAALRRRLIMVTQKLAELWSREPKPVASARSLYYHRALWKLRDIAVDLDTRNDSYETGVQVTLDALCRQFRPDTLAAVRPAGLATLVGREQLESLNERLLGLGIENAEEDSAPRCLLVVRCPHGEQDNLLMACCLLPHFHQSRTSHVFATSIGGPAYFFARAAEMQNLKGFSDALDPPRLCFIAELLQISGWLDHPRIGPLIVRWQRHFGFGPDYLDRTIENASILQSMRETQEQYRANAPAYAPDDFDAFVPAMWERLRRAQAPIVSQADAGNSMRTAGVIDVLNAGWSFVQLHLQDLYETLGSRTAEDQYYTRQRINSLLAQSILSVSGLSGSTGDTSPSVPGAQENEYAAYARGGDSSRW